MSQQRRRVPHRQAPRRSRTHKLASRSPQPHELVVLGGELEMSSINLSTPCRSARGLLSCPGERVLSLLQLAMPNSTAACYPGVRLQHPCPSTAVHPPTLHVHVPANHFSVASVLDRKPRHLITFSFRTAQPQLLKYLL